MAWRRFTELRIWVLAAEEEYRPLSLALDLILHPNLQHWQYLLIWYICWLYLWRLLLARNFKQCFGVSGKLVDSAQDRPMYYSADKTKIWHSFIFWSTDLIDISTSSSNSQKNVLFLSPASHCHFALLATIEFCQKMSWITSSVSELIKGFINCGCPLD